MYTLLLLAALSCGDLCSPAAGIWYDHLLSQGGYGRLPRETAAFLIREADGTLTLQPWEDGGFRHATFRGTVPPRTIAVLHTHPRGETQPSSRDREEARRLGVPVVVITPEGVVAALPAGTLVVR